MLNNKKIMGKRKADCTEEEWKRELERKRLSYIKNIDTYKRRDSKKHYIKKSPLYEYGKTTLTKEQRARLLVRGYTMKDKKYGRETNITPQWVVDNIFSGQHCWYCGEWNWKKLGVDRVNPRIGHIIGNCTPYCKRCNDLKGSKTIGELISTGSFNSN